MLTAAVLVPAVPVAADEDISIRPAAEAPVQLLRPEPGEVLISGRETTIAWRALRDLSAEGIHEWEAFLSFDGGRSWPVRATPHLDISVSSFGFAIPLVPSDDVRLMLRFGDERREVGYVLPMVLSSEISADGWTPPLIAPQPVFGRGEAARPGDPGVVLWVEGAGDGRRIVTRTASWRPITATPSRTAGGRLPAVVTPPDERGHRGTDPIRPSEPTGAGEPDATPARGALYWSSLLLLLCRWNE